MTRPWQIWTAFAGFALAVLAAMSWASATVLRLEHEQDEARRESLLEENVRLALWRIESSLTPLVVRESVRPHFVYSGRYSAARPLSTNFAALHFQFDAGGALTSPQVPGTSAEQEAPYEQRLAALAASVSRSVLIDRLETAPRLDPIPVEVPARRAAVEKSKVEYLSRAANVVQQLALPGPGSTEALGAVEGTAMQPLWVGETLLLARRVRVGDEDLIQGCVLDWEALEQQLVASIADLLPEARLVPASGSPVDEERRVAAMPLTLIPGPRPASPDDRPAPLRLSMLVAWAGVVLAITAVGAALAGVLALSERRRVFVSAVTHELRTPLTTFRMYTEMLASGMVPDEAKRVEYLERLRSEAVRLAHLVENVLFYARIEGGRARASVEPVALRPLVERHAATLRDRAASLGMRLEVSAEAIDAAAQVSANPGAVEQILTNLVDNACKYAAAGGVVRLQLADRGDRAEVRVEDDGPGLARRDRRRLFRPFSKSDREAATSAPGIGLGLALSRRLARAMGGELRHDPDFRSGAAFVLSLKRVSASP